MDNSNISEFCTIQDILPINRYPDDIGLKQFKFEGICNVKQYIYFLWGGALLYAAAIKFPQGLVIPKECSQLHKYTHTQTDGHQDLK